MLFELGNVDIFASDEEWAKLRRPSLIEFIQGRLGRLNDAMGDKQYLVDAFSVADIAMATVLREGVEAGLIAEQPLLQAYLDRKSVVEGKRVAVRVALGVLCINKTKKRQTRDLVELLE